MSEHDFRTSSLDAFLGTLASDSPTPGGGSSAALAGAMGAALVEMLARLTAGRKKYADHDALMQALAEQAAEERAALLNLAAADAAAYDAVSAAYRLPKQDEEQKTLRSAAIEAAMIGACETPLAIMQHSLEVLALAKNAVLYGNTNAASDGAAGAELARAAMKIASYNVKINLGAIGDAHYVQQARARMDEMTQLGTGAATAVETHVEELWQPAGTKA